MTKEQFERLMRCRTRWDFYLFDAAMRGKVVNVTGGHYKIIATGVTSTVIGARPQPVTIEQGERVGA